jgi:hypothetical protein
LVNASGARLPDNWELECQQSDWATSLPVEDELDSNAESLSNAPPTISSTTYYKLPVLDFTTGSLSNISVPKKLKKILPFDDGSLEHDYSIFSFDQYDLLPPHDVPFAKGPISNDHIEILTHVAWTFKNHLCLLSAPDQSHCPVHHLKAMLFQISSMNVEKTTSPYNMFLHQYHQQTDTRGNDFIVESTKAYNDLKESFSSDEEGWKAKCKEIVQSYDLENVRAC